LNKKMMNQSIVARNDKTLVMGILNVTPDSFYDGGKWCNIEQAVLHADKLVAAGADILDIGGESSRPGAEPVSAEEECSRVLPVLEALLQQCEVPISVDTYRASTAECALELGAAMINDISGLRFDPEMPGIVAASGCACVVMHMQGMPKTMQQMPRYDNVVDDIKSFFVERVDSLMRQGIHESNIWLDPGFGFGKSVDHNLEIMQRLGEFKQLGLPLLIGTSNKVTIGKLLGNAPVNERMEGTAATVALAIAQGADAVRVHDVKSMSKVAAVSDAIIRRRKK